MIELDKLWTGKVGDMAHGYCIDGFLPDTELGRVIRLRRQTTGEFFLLTALAKQTTRLGREETDFLLEQMRFASEHFRHENLQQVPLCGTFRDQRFFIVQESPHTLTQYIQTSGGKLIPPVALSIAFQMLDALEFLHHIPAREEGTARTCVTHDYLTPDHILLTDEGVMPTVKLSAQHKLYLGQDDDEPLYGDPIQSFYLPVEAWFHNEKTGRVKTNLWTVTALLHSMLTGLPDFDDPTLFTKKLQGEPAFPAVNRRNLSVPPNLAKLIDTVLAQRDFPYEIAAAEYKNMLEESARQPVVPAPREDGDDLLREEAAFEDVDDAFCKDALVLSSPAAPVPGAAMPSNKPSGFPSEPDAVPPARNQGFLSKGTRLLDAFEITSDEPETNDLGWYRYSARRTPPESPAREYTVIQAQKNYGPCFTRLEQWRELNHPNIRRLLAMGFHSGDSLALVFEEAKDANDTWLRDMGKLRAENWDGFIKDLLDTTLGCARGLSFLHQHKRIHGDLKPSNLCGQRLNTKLDGLWLPENGGFTPAYASPEQFLGQEVGVGTDLWSLGVTLVELLLGDRPWNKGPGCGLIYEKQLKARCKPLPDVLWKVLRGCLQMDASQRMGVNALLELLEDNRRKTEPELFEGYRRLNPINRQGDVWLVRNSGGRYLALKQFQPELPADEATRADKNLDFLSRYGHGAPGGNDHILRCFDRSPTYDSLRYCVMEYCPGGDLETRIRRKGPLPLATALLITEQLLDVLAYLQQGYFFYQYKDGLVYTGPVWHKQIEPRHILLMDDGARPEIRLKGFGDAVPQWDAIKGLNYAHRIPSTFSGFVCRDTALSIERYEPAGDVWAVAAVLYAMLTGQVPRSSEMQGRKTQFSFQELNHLPVIPIRMRAPDLPASLAMVIDDALREEPLNRHKPEELWSKLKNACTGNP